MTLGGHIALCHSLAGDKFSFLSTPCLIDIAQQRAGLCLAQWLAGALQDGPHDGLMQIGKCLPGVATNNYLA